MPVNHGIWRIGDKILQVKRAELKSEEELESIIEQNPEVLNDSWLILGRQVMTAYNQYIDLLAIDNTGSIIILELKKKKTPREVVAQAIDYASWVRNLNSSDIALIFKNYINRNSRTEKSLDQFFLEKFKIQLEEDMINSSHQIVIVASDLDSSTERIIHYLNDADIPINVVFFKVFEDGGQRYISRAWLIDPFETSKNASIVDRGRPWNEEFYVSFGQGESRNWEDAVEYGFISGGGGLWYSRTLNLLAPGDRIWVNIPKTGYVGVGLVTDTAKKADEVLFETASGNKNIYELSEKSHYYSQNKDDEDEAEYLVRVDWRKTLPPKNAVSELGFFGNQNTVCKPTTIKWDHTVNRLKTLWGID